MAMMIFALCVCTTGLSLIGLLGLAIEPVLLSIAKKFEKEWEDEDIY